MDFLDDFHRLRHARFATGQYAREYSVLPSRCLRTFMVQGKYERERKRNLNYPQINFIKGNLLAPCWRSNTRGVTNLNVKTSRVQSARGIDKLWGGKSPSETRSRSFFAPFSRRIAKKREGNVFNFLACLHSRCQSTRMTKPVVWCVRPTSGYNRSSTNVRSNASMRKDDKADNNNDKWKERKPLSSASIEK